jgi:hypothetical protein
MTPEKETLMHQMNEHAQKTYEAARQKAVQEGRPLPKEPAVLKPSDIEYPKFLYSGNTPKFVKDAAEHKALLAKDKNLSEEPASAREERAKAAEKAKAEEKARAEEQLKE